MAKQCRLRALQAPKPPPWVPAHAVYLTWILHHEGKSLFKHVSHAPHILRLGPLKAASNLPALSCSSSLSASASSIGALRLLSHISSFSASGLFLHGKCDGRYTSAGRLQDAPGANCVFRPLHDRQHGLAGQL